MARIGYARKSTSDQNLNAEVERLKAAGCDPVFSDSASGKLADRPGWDEARKYLRPGDELVVTKLDRLGRSVRNLAEILDNDIKAKGVTFVALDQGIDTSTAMGELFWNLLAAFAQFEHSLIVERTREGLAASKKRGHGGGRKPKLEPYQVEDARRWLEQGQTVTQVAARLKVSRQVVYRALNGTGKGH